MEDEVVRIAKKMDKMVQKKNAVSGGRAGGRAGPGQAETATPAHAEPVGPRRAARPPGLHGGAGNVRREPGPGPSPSERCAAPPVAAERLPGGRGPSAGGRVRALPRTRVGTRDCKSAVSGQAGLVGYAGQPWLKTTLPAGRWGGNGAEVVAGR